MSTKLTVKELKELDYAYELVVGHVIEDTFITVVPTEWLNNAPFTSIQELKDNEDEYPAETMEFYNFPTLTGYTEYEVY